MHYKKRKITRTDFWYRGAIIFKAEDPSGIRKYFVRDPFENEFDTWNETRAWLDEHPRALSFTRTQEEAVAWNEFKAENMQGVA